MAQETAQQRISRFQELYSKAKERYAAFPSEENSNEVSYHLGQLGEARYQHLKERSFIEEMLTQLENINGYFNSPIPRRSMSEDQKNILMHNEVCIARIKDYLK